MRPGNSVEEGRMASLSERVLGKRIINYLKNEALVGRISQKKLQVTMQ